MTYPTKLKDAASGELVAAELHDVLQIEALFDAQAQWAPSKIEIAKECLKCGIDRRLLPQSLHWNWADKAAVIKPYAPGPLSSFCLFGISAQAKWQGMLLACCVGYHARLGSSGRDLVYVEFVENAPWNWDLPAIGHRAWFKGVGAQLVELALRWSVALGFRGRVGLHALPQSEMFYREGCGMTDLGPDSKNRHGLRYFEFTEVQAQSFLQEDNP